MGGPGVLSADPQVCSRKGGSPCLVYQIPYPKLWGCAIAHERSCRIRCGLNFFILYTSTVYNVDKAENRLTLACPVLPTCQLWYTSWSLACHIPMRWRQTPRPTRKLCAMDMHHPKVALIRAVAVLSTDMSDTPSAANVELKNYASNTGLGCRGKSAGKNSRISRSPMCEAVAAPALREIAENLLRGDGVKAGKSNRDFSAPITIMVPIAGRTWVHADCTVPLPSRSLASISRGTPNDN